MSDITTFAQAESKLQDFISNAPAGPYRLDRIRQFLAYIDNPQDKLRVIHVAGTSGKTSTSYYLAAILRTTGASVGLTVSPHIDTIDERLNVDGQPIGEAAFCAAVDEFLPLIAKSGIHLTYFEVLMALAYWYFAEIKLDYVVIETGLGGLCDASNTVSRSDKYCVITDIGLDHMSVLGDTVEAIATQKAGIIRGGNIVFMNQQSSAIMEVFKRTCSVERAQLHIIDGAQQFQERNWGLALATITELAKTDDLIIKDVAGARATLVPGRMELLNYKDHSIILDGSHNPQKIQALIRALPSNYKEHSTLIVSFGANKTTAIKENLMLLRSVTDTIVVTEFDLGGKVLRQAYPADKIAKLAREVGFKRILTEANPFNAMDAALSLNASSIIVTGSFYLLNHLRPLIINS